MNEQADEHMIAVQMTDMLQGHHIEIQIQVLEKARLGAFNMSNCEPEASESL